MRVGTTCFAIALLALAAPSALAEGCQLTPIDELHVSMQGLDAVAPAKINGLDAKLAIDTGAFFSILAPGSAARLRLKLSPLPANMEVRGLGGRADVHFTTAKSLQLLAEPIPNAGFLVGEHGFGPDVDGVIGQNILAAADDVEFDFAHGVIRFFVEKNCGDRALAYWASGTPYGVVTLDPIELRPRTWGDNQPKTEIRGGATLNGATIRVILDTGAGRSVLTLRAAQRAGVKSDGPGVVHAENEFGIGKQAVGTWLAPFSSFDIGGEQVKSTHLRIADVQLDDADMLLGADFFLSHRIMISVAHSKAYFTYNGGPVFNLGLPVAVGAAPSSKSPGAASKAPNQTAAGP